MNKLSEMKSTCLRDTLEWIVANEHHRGYWTGVAGKRTFVLEGESAKLTIPEAVHVPGMMEGADYEKTKRMYEPSSAGRTALLSQRPNPGGGERFAKFSNDEAAVMPEGWSAQLSGKTTRELMSERLSIPAQPASDGDLCIKLTEAAERLEARGHAFGAREAREAVAQYQKAVGGANRMNDKGEIPPARS